MPLPPRTDPRPLGAAQPIADGIQQAGHAVMHPLDALKQMLGMSPDPNQPPVQHGADPGMVREANESFIHPTPNPVVAPPARMKSPSNAGKEFFPPNVQNDQFQYGPKNLKHMQNDTNAWASGVQGYPSDDEYMKNVGEAGIEAQQNRMRLPTFTPWTPPRRKPMQ